MAAGYIKLVLEMPVGSQVSAKRLAEHKEALSNRTLVVPDHGPTSAQYAHVKSKVQHMRPCGRPQRSKQVQDQPEGERPQSAGARARVRVCSPYCWRPALRQVLLDGA